MAIPIFSQTLLMGQFVRGEEVLLTHVATSMVSSLVVTGVLLLTVRSSMSGRILSSGTENRQFLSDYGQSAFFSAFTQSLPIEINILCKPHCVYSSD